MQAALWVGRIGPHRRMPFKPAAILTAASKNTVKTAGGNQVLAEVLVAEAQHADQPRNPAASSARQVACTRIRAPHMRSERTAQPLLVFVIGELVARNVESLWSHATDRLHACGKQCSTRKLPPHHCLRQRDAVRVVVRLRCNETPESADILGKLAQHQIAAVAAEVMTDWIVLRSRQNRCAWLFRIEQRAVSVETVLIAITQQELSRRQQIAIVKIIRSIWLAIAGPIHPRLADTIREPKRLLAAHVTRVQTVEHRKTGA
jgi:hypothetical protein